MKTQLYISIGAYCGLPSVHFVLLTFSNMSNCWLSDVHLLITLKNVHFADVSCGCLRLHSHSLKTAPQLCFRRKRLKISCTVTRV